MMLPKFVFINSPEFPGIEFILCTNPPFYIYRVYQFHSKEDLEKFSLKHTIFANFTSEGYNIILTSAGHLENFQLTPPRENIPLEYQIPGLKLWYFDNRIKGNETRMKKYKS